MASVVATSVVVSSVDVSSVLDSVELVSEAVSVTVSFTVEMVVAVSSLPPQPVAKRAREKKGIRNDFFMPHTVAKQGGGCRSLCRAYGN